MWTCVCGCWSCSSFAPTGPTSDWIHSLAAGPAGECDSAGSQPVCHSQPAADWGRYNAPGTKPSFVIRFFLFCFQPDFFFFFSNTPLSSLYFSPLHLVRRCRYAAADIINALSARYQTGRTTCCCLWCCACVSAWCCVPTIVASPLFRLPQSQSHPWQKATPSALLKGSKTLSAPRKYL